MCGMNTERKGPDWSETVFTGEFAYGKKGRLIVPAMPDINGDGRTTPEVRCTGPLDCGNK